MQVQTFSSVRAALITAIWLAVCATSVHAGDAGGGGPAGKSKAVTVETIQGSTVKRVILSAKAAERLGIETGKVSQDMVTRKQVVSGMIVYPQQQLQPGLMPASTTMAAAPKGTSFASFGGGFNSPIVMAPPAAGQIKDAGMKTGTLSTNATGQSEVVVTLSPTEYERIDKAKPARVTPLYTRDKDVAPMTAPLSDTPPVEDARRSMLTLRYLLPVAAHSLPPSTRMRVELQMADSGDSHKLVPYRSVFYDSKGSPWVYVNTKPLTYERQPIKIKNVVGDMAVLSEGPPLDTPIVTVGASLLYGSEVFGK